MAVLNTEVFISCEINKVREEVTAIEAYKCRKFDVEVIVDSFIDEREFKLL